MRIRIKASELASLMGCSQSAATKLIATMNKELQNKGYLTLRGSIPVKYAYERLNIKEIEINGDSDYEKQNQN